MARVCITARACITASYFGRKSSTCVRYINVLVPILWPVLNYGHNVTVRKVTVKWRCTVTPFVSVHTCTHTHKALHHKSSRDNMRYLTRAQTFPTTETYQKHSHPQQVNKSTGIFCSVHLVQLASYTII